MTAESEFQLVVERVDVLPSRPWVFVSGRLAGAPVTVGAHRRESIRLGQMGKWIIDMEAV